MPGAFSPVVAMAVEDAGFEGVYVSGAALSADLGLPDVGQEHSVGLKLGRRGAVNQSARRSARRRSSASMRRGRSRFAGTMASTDPTSRAR